MGARYFNPHEESIGWGNGWLNPKRDHELLTMKGVLSLWMP